MGVKEGQLVSAFLLSPFEVKPLFVTSSCRGGMIQSFYLLVCALIYRTPVSLTVPDLLYVRCFCEPTWLFFSPGVVAVSDPRGSAADPPGPGLGAFGGGALCGAGGLLTQQVN